MKQKTHVGYAIQVSINYILIDMPNMETLTCQIWRGHFCRTPCTIQKSGVPDNLTFIVT